MLFGDFRKAYPDLWRNGTTYEPYGFMSILIKIPGRGKVIYEYFGDKLTWLEHWIDENEIKEKEREMRPKLYDYFCFMIEEYMKDTGATQQDLADISGISRQSINKYLTGKSIPKNSTMKKICDSIGIEF
jgi:DNA-binding XRE family transcriptional regulator